MTELACCAGCGEAGGTPKEHAASYEGLTAASSEYFQLRMVARDAAGQTSIPAPSDAQNTGRWSVFAGSPDRGVG